MMELTPSSLASLPLSKIQNFISNERSKLSDNSYSYVIKEGYFSKNNQTDKVLRLFIADKNRNTTCDVSWMISDTINRCTECFHDFEDKLKYHCVACGDVICSKCCHFDSIRKCSTASHRFCTCCYEDAEKDDKLLKSYKNWGLPVIMSNLQPYGDCTVAFVKSVAVIKLMNSPNIGTAHVNICISSSFERNGKENFPNDLNSEILHMVYGPSSIADDGIKVHTVVVHHDDILEKSKKVFDQAVNFVARVTGENISLFEVLEDVSYYSHKLTETENVKLFEATKRGFVCKKYHGIKVLLPNKKAFKKLYQIPTYLKEYELWYKNKNQTNISITNLSEIIGNDKTIILRNGRRARSSSEPEPFKCPTIYEMKQVTKYSRRSSFTDKNTEDENSTIENKSKIGRIFNFIGFFK